MRRKRSLGVLFLQYFVFSHLEIVPAFFLCCLSPAHTHGSERGGGCGGCGGETAIRLHGYTATRLHGHAGQPCRPVQRECLSVVSNVVEFASLRICRITTQITRIPTYRHCVESCISIASHILVRAGSRILVQAGSHVLMQTSDGI